MNEEATFAFYGIRYNNHFMIEDWNKPMIVYISKETGQVFIKPNLDCGLEHFAMFAIEEFNTENYSIRNQDGTDFNSKDEGNPDGDFKKIKNYIDLILQVLPEP